MCPVECTSLEVRLRPLHHDVWVQRTEPLLRIADENFVNIELQKRHPTYLLSVGVVLLETSWLRCIQDHIHNYLHRGAHYRMT